MNIDADAIIITREIVMEDLNSIASHTGLIDYDTLGNSYFYKALNFLEKKRQGILREMNHIPVKVSDDKYRIIVLSDSDGYIYRGENCAAYKLAPGLMRLSGDSKIAEWSRTNIFIKWIKSSVYYKALTNLQYKGFYFDPDFEAIAQHYGMKTNYLDFTSDINVAKFFAYTEFDNGIYKPIEHFKSCPKLYRIKMCDLIKNNPHSFKIVGFQCSARAIAQKALAIDFSEDINLEGMEEIYLDTDPKKSTDIYNRFNKGRDLFPNDLLTNIQNNIFNNKHYATYKENIFIDLDIKKWLNWLKDKTYILEKAHLGDSKDKKLITGLEFLVGQISDTDKIAVIIQKKEK